MFGWKHQFVHKQHHKIAVLILWFFGFVLGCWFAGQADDYLCFLMRTSLGERVSIVWLLGASIFPVIILGLILFSKSAIFASCFSFFKALVFGFSLVCISTAFSSASWLVFLILFIPIFLKDAIWLFIVLGNVVWDVNRIKTCLLLFAVTLLALNVFDYISVSPFLAELLY